MNSVLERWLYITLAALLVGVMVMIWLFISLDQKINQQLKYEQQQQQGRSAHTQEIISELKTEVSGLKDYINQLCMANGCKVASPVPTPITTAPKAPTSPVASKSTAPQSQNTPAPSAPTPSPTSPPSLTQRIFRFITGLF